jgi:hypothetical protein
MVRERIGSLYMCSGTSLGPFLVMIDQALGTAQHHSIIDLSTERSYRIYNPSLRTHLCAASCTCIL